MIASRRTVIQSAAALSVLTLAGAHARAQTHPEASTRTGRVRGYSQSGLSVFKGIPYGADTRWTRFAKPKPAAAWPGVRDALTYGPASPQRGSSEAMSEDCLVLNVWTPGTESAALRPVMVYIHGGAYASGSGSAEVYDGARLASGQDVVVVTLNHRLNAFGYLSLGRLNPEFADAGNAGMWDLVLALEWIRDNARAFGGDPQRVMLFGQSGGGAKIATLMVAPSANGLFHSAATMSGQQVTASGPLNGEARARAFLDKIGVKPEDTAALRSITTEKLIDGLSARDPVNASMGLYLGPVLDGRFLMRHPFWPDAPSQSAKIPMILGNTLHETRNLIGQNEPEAFALNWADVPSALVRHMRCDIEPAEVVARYRLLHPQASPSDVFFAASTAARSWRGQVEEADARARAGHPTWVYRFDLASDEDGGKWGAGHGADIPYAFGNLDAAPAVRGTTPPKSDAARRVSAELSKAFVQLARKGAPVHSGLPDWKRYTTAHRRTMVFGGKTELMRDPRGEERALFAKVPFTQWGT